MRIRLGCEWLWWRPLLPPAGDCTSAHRGRQQNSRCRSGGRREVDRQSGARGAWRDKAFYLHVTWQSVHAPRNESKSENDVSRRTDFCTHSHSLDNLHHPRAFAVRFASATTHGWLGKGALSLAFTASALCRTPTRVWTSTKSPSTIRPQPILQSPTLQNSSLLARKERISIFGRSRDMPKSLF